MCISLKKERKRERKRETERDRETERERERDRERDRERERREREKERDGIRVLNVAVNSHCMTVMGVTPLLDNYEIFANMWLPNCTVNMVATNSCFDKCRRHCVLAELNVEHMLASSPDLLLGMRKPAKYLALKLTQLSICDLASYFQWGKIEIHFLPWMFTRNMVHCFKPLNHFV